MTILRPSAARAAGPLLVAVALASGCGAATPSVSDPSPPASPDPSPAPIVIDTDMGADDILAIAMLLHEPSVEVRAITVAGTGLAHCAPGLRNLRGLLHQLGIEAMPIGCGSEDAGDDGRPFPDEWRVGTDAAYGLEMPPVAGSDAGAEADELLARTLEAAASPMTIVVLGPWTNLEALLTAEPSAASHIARLHVMGGTLDASGNVADAEGRLVEPSLEWNLAADPSAVAAVMAHDIPTSFVSLDATDQVPLDHGVLEALTADHSAAGADIAHELFVKNPYMLEGGTFLWDELAAATLTDPGLVSWESVEVTVDASGHLTRRAGSATVEITTGVDPEAALSAVLTALSRGPARADPFELAGHVDVVWDGKTCSLGGLDGPGYYTAAVENLADLPVVTYVVVVPEPHTWSDLEDFIAELQPNEPADAPEWLKLAIAAYVEPRTTSDASGSVTSGAVGPVCTTDVGSAAPTFVTGEPGTVGE